MSSTVLYATILGMLILAIPHSDYGNLGRLYTLTWAVVGLLIEKTVSLTVWATVIQGRAQWAASRYRRVHRWIHNEKVKPHSIYAPLVRAALARWTEACIYVALDTSVLWNKYVLVRLSLIYRGRAVPLVWTVLAHTSARVAFVDYRDVLYRAAELFAPGQRVVLLADRGFCDVELLLALKKLGWHYRIRAKQSLTVYRTGQRKGCPVERMLPGRGQARFIHRVMLTHRQIGPVHLALAWPTAGQKDPDPWIVISDEPTDLTTFDEYGLRFDIEENFLDDKSNAFQVQESEIRSASALSRLFLVLAIATLYLVSTGEAVVRAQLRRVVDTHWERGLSYLQIGWRWIRRCLAQGAPVPNAIALSPDPDPEPARASRSKPRLCFTFVTLTDTS